MLGTFTNGRLESWIESRTLSPDDLKDRETSAKIAKRLAELHACPVNGDRRPALWRKLDSWIESALEITFTGPSENAALQSLNLPRVASEIQWLKSRLSDVPSPVVFCHNDALAGNILERPDGRIELVDMEYGSYNFRGFDIGNHFCEFSGFDYTKITDCYPNKAAQYNFIESYIRLGRSPSEFVTDDELDSLYREANEYALASHLFWGVWAVLQAKYSKVDFDYLLYARQRINAYFYYKRQLLGSEELDK